MYRPRNAYRLELIKADGESTYRLLLLASLSYVKFGIAGNELGDFIRISD